MKTKLIMLMLLCSINISAQDTRMLADCPRWMYSSRVYDMVTYPTPIGYTNTERNYSLTGYYEKDGKTYYTLSCEVYDVTAKPGIGQVSHSNIESFSLTIREDNGKIFADAEEFLSLYGNDSAMLYEQIDDEFLIYDFTLKEGDSFGPNGVFVDRIDTIITEDGIERKLFVLSSKHKILEGVGCLYSKGNLMNYLAFSPVEEISIGWQYSFLGSFIQKDKLVFGISSADADMIVTNIRSQQIGLSDSSLYDFSGRRLPSLQGGAGLPKGMYIQGGKKFVIK